MKFTANYDQAKDLIKAGVHPCVVDSIDAHVSKNGTRCVKVAFSITDGLSKSRKLTKILTLEGPGAGFFRSFVQSILPEYVDGDVDADSLIGKQVAIEVQPAISTPGKRAFPNVRILPADSWLLLDQFVRPNEEGDLE